MIHNFKDFLNESDLSSYRFRHVVTKDFKYIGAVDHITPDRKLRIEITSDGDWVEYLPQDVIVIPEKDEDILMDAPYAVFNDEDENYGTYPTDEDIKKLKDFMEKHFKNLINKSKFNL
jgi:hypothetical protein